MMDYANERYVLLYTRDTTTWKLLDWEARAVLMFLLRKVDRAGVLDVGPDGLEGLAAVLEVPLDVVARAMPKLTAKQTVTATGTAFVLPNFIEAQETPRSDKQRQRDSRERRRSTALSRNVTDGHETGPNVTNGHTASQPVTPSQAKPTEPTERETRAVGPVQSEPGSLAPLIDFAVDELNRHRKAIDPAAQPIAEFDDQPGRRKLLDRLRETAADQRKPKIIHAITVLSTEARLTGDVGRLRLGMLGGDASWPRLQLATVAGTKARASPPGQRPTPAPALAPVGKGPAPVSVDRSERAAAAAMLGDTLKSLGIPTGDPP